jgi:hypothetical protein
MDDDELDRLLQERAGKVRASYPEGLEADLDAAWQRAKGRRPTGAELAALNQELERLASHRFAIPAVEATSSRLGGAAIHRIVSKSVERHFGDLVGQLDAYASLLSHALTALAELSHDAQHDVSGQLVAMEYELAQLRRAANGSTAPELPQ